MKKVSTARLLIKKKLEEACGQQCVDWASGMLMAGHDNDALCILASMRPPFNHFELADLRDKALSELKILDISTLEAGLHITKEVLEEALHNETELAKTIEWIKDLCIALDYPSELYDFYSLYYAHFDLQHSDVQFYWSPDATKETIESIMREEAEEFLNKYQNLKKLI